MNAWLTGGHAIDAVQLLALFGHFLLLSLLAIGGVMATAPDMHRFVVGERGWLDDTQFTASVALAQAAPGPNLLVVAVLGWNVAGPAGVVATLVGNLLPSTLLALSADRWGQRLRDAPALRAFKAGMAPLTLGLLLATGWVLTDPIRDTWRPLLLVAATVLFMLRLRVAPIWPIAAGALLGALGFV